jgi:hypothetical protein
MIFLLLFLVAVCVVSFLSDFGPAALRLTMLRLFVLSGVVINLAALQRLGWIAALGLGAGWCLAILLNRSEAMKPLGKLFNFALVLTLLLFVYPVGLSVLFHVAATHALVAVLAVSVLLGLCRRHVRQRSLRQEETRSAAEQADHEREMTSAISDFKLATERFHQV